MNLSFGLRFHEGFFAYIHFAVRSDSMCKLSLRFYGGFFE